MQHSSGAIKMLPEGEKCGYDEEITKKNCVPSLLQDLQ